MTNKIIFTLIGMILGGVVSGVFVGASCAKTYKKRIDELTDENNQLYSQLHEKKREDIRKREEKARLKDAELNVSIMNQMELAREEKRKTAEMVKKHGYSTEEGDDDYDIDEDVEFDDPFDEGESVVVKKEEEPRKPMFSMMSQEEYEEDFEYRDSESLTYYQKDKVLADAFDDRVGNAVEIVGEEALNKAQETDQDYIYVMDEVEDKMYEIAIDHEESYYRDSMRGGVM